MLVGNGINQLILIIDTLLHQVFFAALSDLQWPESQVEIHQRKLSTGMSLQRISTEKTKNSCVEGISLSLIPTDWIF